jgi:hypothetical protein
MKITVKDDDGREYRLDDEPSTLSNTLQAEMSPGVRKRVITIERPAEKTPGERLYCIVNQAFRWDALLPTRQRDWDRYAEEFNASELAHWQAREARDWAERRVFIGEIERAGANMVVQARDGREYDCFALLSWIARGTARVTVDRLKDT